MLLNALSGRDLFPLLLSFLSPFPLHSVLLKSSGFIKEIKYFSLKLLHFLSSLGDLGSNAHLFPGSLPLLCYYNSALQGTILWADFKGYSL